MRPLFWSDWSDRFLWNVEDAFYLGDALLVCPIVQQGERSRTISLPQGYWYNFWNDSMMEGGKMIELDSPLEQIPLLVKAGGILPIEEGQQLILHLYSLVKGAGEKNPPFQNPKSKIQNFYTLYTDAGDGYGESRLDRFKITQHGKILELVWEQQGNYGFPYQSVQLNVHGMSLQQVWVDAREATVQGQQLQCYFFKQIRFHYD